MDLHRCGALRRAVLYDVLEEARGEVNLRDCVADANGKVGSFYVERIKPVMLGARVSSVVYESVL